MNKITCISYHNTGSGAVDDFLREFKGIQLAPYGIECRVLQDPDGISDLEYNLIDNWHRLNSGFAIKRFERFVRINSRNYSKIFGENWIKASKRFIDRIIDFEFPGYWHADINEQPIHKWLFYKFRRFLSKFEPKKYRKNGDYNYFPKLKSYHTRISRNKFYYETKDYIDSLCDSIANESTKYIVLDQLIPTTNIARYVNYVRDLKIILVDRDPRDLYLQGTIGGTHVLPHDPKLFSRQYRDMRKTVYNEIKNENVLKIQFEDLIYKYDETTNKIMDFLGLTVNEHIYPKKYFNPDKSIRNTQIWKKIDGYEEQLNIIKEELSEYFYEAQVKKEESK